MTLKKAQRQKAGKTSCELVGVFLQESEFTGHCPLEPLLTLKVDQWDAGQQAVAIFFLDSTDHTVTYMGFICLIILLTAFFFFFKDLFILEKYLQHFWIMVLLILRRNSHIIHFSHYKFASQWMQQVIGTWSHIKLRLVWNSWSASVHHYVQQNVSAPWGEPSQS